MKGTGVEDVGKLLRTNKVGLFGAGQYGKEVLGELADIYNITCFIDNASALQGKCVCNVEVYSLETAMANGIETVIISTVPRKVTALLPQLRNAGVKHIFHLVPSILYNRRTLGIKDYDRCFMSFANLENGGYGLPLPRNGSDIDILGEPSDRPLQLELQGLHPLFSALPHNPDVCEF